jgi:hypothetical protein
MDGGEYSPKHRELVWVRRVANTRVGARRMHVLAAYSLAGFLHSANQRGDLGRPMIASSCARIGEEGSFRSHVAVPDILALKVSRAFLLFERER